MVLGIVVLVLGALDVAARAAAEGQVEDEARAEAGPAGVAASIRGLPFVPRLLVGAAVPEVRVRVTELVVGRFTFEAVDIRLQGVEVDRDVLVRERRIRLVDIDQGTVSAEVSAPALSEVFGRVLETRGGDLGEGVGLRAEGQRLVLTVGQRDVAGVVLPEDPLVPCIANVTVLAGRVRLSCTIEEVPPALVRAVNQALSTSGS